MMMVMGPEAAVMPSLQIKVLKDDSVCVCVCESHTLSCTLEYDSTVCSSVRPSGAWCN